MAGLWWILQKMGEIMLQTWVGGECDFGWEEGSLRHYLTTGTGSLCFPESRA